MKDFLLELMPHVKHIIYHCLTLERMPNDFGNDVKVDYIYKRERSAYLKKLEAEAAAEPTLIVLEIYDDNFT